MTEKMVNIVLPIPKEEIVKYFNHFNEYTFIVDYKKSLSNLKSNHKILTYISNCEMIDTLIDNYDYDENFEDFLIEYIKSNTPVSVSLLAEIWCSILCSKYEFISDEKLLSFARNFRNNHKDLIQECNEFFFSLNKALENIIVPTDKDLEEKITKAESNHLKLCGLNIVSLENAVNFYQYIGSIELDKIYMYDEFTHNVLNGMSVTRFFILNDPFYRNLYTYNRIAANPQEEGNKIQKILDELNNMRSE